MPNNILKMTFNAPVPIDGYIRYKLNGVLVTETFKPIRTGFGEVTANEDIPKTIFNYKDALTLDYPDTYNTTTLGNVLTLEAKDFNSVFTEAESSSSINFAYSSSVNSIEVSGLTGNGYLINNDIIVGLTGGTGTYYTISLYNNNNQKSTSTIRVYKSPEGTGTINLSPLVKSIFDYPLEANNYVTANQTQKTLNNIRVTIGSQGSFTNYTVTKSFVRGGNRTNDTNQTIDSNTWLTPSVKIPIWQGYSLSADYIVTTGLTRAIYKRLQNEIPVDLIDYRRSRGCNEMLVKFLNQMGGYSYWLFDSNKETETNTNQGSFIRDNKVSDLGNESDSNLQAYSKVPKEYIELIKDIIVSPEIYCYMDGKYVRVLSKSNSITIDDNKRAYAVNIKFDFDYRFNPSILWSN